MEVVVVLPCMPATAMPYLSRMSSASISARWMTGILRCRASTTSGFCSLTAELVTTTPEPNHVARPRAPENGGAQAHQPVGNAGLAQVGAGNGIAEGQQNFGDAAHADAANANEMNALRFRKHSWRGKGGETHSPLL